MHCGYRGGNLVQVPLSERDNRHTHIRAHTHLTWFTVLSYNPICGGRVSLMTWQPRRLLYLLSGNPTSHLLSSRTHGWVLFVSRHPSLEVNCSSGQTLESFFPMANVREANYRQRASLPIMLCSGFVWNKLESHYDKRCVVIRFNGCIIAAVCVCVCVCVCARWWCINHAVIRSELE